MEAGVGNGNPPSRISSEGGVLSVSRYERRSVVLKKTLHHLKIKTEAGVGEWEPSVSRFERGTGVGRGAVSLPLREA